MPEEKPKLELFKFANTATMIIARTVKSAGRQYLKADGTLDDLDCAEVFPSEDDARRFAAKYDYHVTN